MLLLLIAAALVFGAADEWAKVKALKTGADIRVFKKGSMQPVLGQMDELTDDNLVLLVKKTQTAIPKDQIDRIDARPVAGSRVVKETTTKETYADAKNAAPGSSTSTNVSVGSKPDFETVYRRAVGAPKK
jgi:hypothetical protein